MSLFYGQDMFGNFPTQPNVGRMPPTTPQQQPELIPLYDPNDGSYGIPAQQDSGMFTATNPINYTGTTSSGTMDKLAGAAGIGGLLLGANPMNVLAGGLSYTAGQEGIDQIRQLPNMLGQQAADISNQVGQAAEFRPYTVKSGAGNIGVTSSGIDFGTNATQQALQQQGQLMANQIGQGIPNMSGMTQQAMGAASGMLGANSGQFANRLGGEYAGVGQNMLDQAQQANTVGGLQGQFTQQAMQGAPTATAESVYDQIRAMQAPEEERQQTALEERLAAQGRLGIQTNQYGGTPEQLAQQKALAEAKNQASLQALSTADNLATSQAARQTQAGQLAGQLGQIGGNLTAQQQELGQRMMGMGLDAQRLGGTLTAQDFQNATAAYGMGSQSAQLGNMLQGQQINNLTGMLSAAGIPMQQQLAALQGASPYTQMAQNARTLQAQTLANLGQQGMMGTVDAMNAEALMRQSQMEALTNALRAQGGTGSTGGGGLDIGGMISGAGDLLGDGYNWLTGLFSDSISDGSTGGDLLDTIVKDYDVNRDPETTISGDASLNARLGLGG